MPARSPLFRVSLGLLALGAVVVIAYLALRPSPWVGEIHWIPRWLGEWADRHGNFRNLPAFAALAAVLIFTLGARWGLALAASLAVGLEVAQSFIAERTFDWADIAWALAGVALVGAVHRGARRRGRPAIP